MNNGKASTTTEGCHTHVGILDTSSCWFQVFEVETGGQRRFTEALRELETAAVQAVAEVGWNLAEWSASADHVRHAYHECNTTAYHDTPDKLCTLHV